MSHSVINDINQVNYCIFFSQNSKKNKKNVFVITVVKYKIVSFLHHPLLPFSIKTEASCLFFVNSKACQFAHLFVLLNISHRPVSNNLFNPQILRPTGTFNFFWTMGWYNRHFKPKLNYHPKMASKINASLRQRSNLTYGD